MVNVPVALFDADALMSNDILSIMFSMLNVIPLIVKSSSDADEVSVLITLNDKKLLLVRLPFDTVLTA